MEVYRYAFTKPDGRKFFQFSRQPFPVGYEHSSPGLLRPADWSSPTLRYNSERDEYVAISTSRNNRPFLPPKEYCPLCPSTDPAFATEVPDSPRVYEWAVFENMFPALALGGAGTGRCEVILYSPDHSTPLANQPLEQIEGLGLVWQDRSRDLGSEMKQVFLFENKGAEIGVTLHHPHGQAYAFHQVPPFLKKEQEAAEAHFGKTGKCLICDQRDKEIHEKHRVVYENDHFVAFVPFAARYPYEVHITTREHRPLIEDLKRQEIKGLATALKSVLMAYDKLFGFPMPYILAHHQASHKSPLDPTYHWHMELYPPYRSKDKLKYLAGVESGTGFFVNDTNPEEKAAEIRSLVNSLGSLE